jgi:hypothetical protein
MLLGPGATAVYDACVLYPNVLRDTLLSLAGTGLFRAKWTQRIHAEWIGAVLRSRPDIPPDKLERLSARMDATVPDCLVEGWEPLEAFAAATLPDPGDGHVLAAAIRCQAGIIVTKNLRDFPAAALAPYDLQTQHPDDFITYLLDLDPVAVCRELRRQRQRWRSPPANVPEFLETLARQELPLTVDALRRFAEFL